MAYPALRGEAYKSIRDTNIASSSCASQVCRAFLWKLTSFKWNMSVLVTYATHTNSLTTPGGLAFVGLWNGSLCLYSGIRFAVGNEGVEAVIGSVMHETS